MSKFDNYEESYKLNFESSILIYIYIYFKVKGRQIIGWVSGELGVMETGAHKELYLDKYYLFIYFSTVLKEEKNK